MDHWRLSAACRGADSHLFFVSERHSIERKTALAICKGCSVRRYCLEDALDHEDSYVRGGTTEEERKIMLLFRKALTPISTLTHGLQNTGLIESSHTVQVSLNISHISTLDRPPVLPTPSFELDQSKFLAPCNQGPSNTLNPPRVVESLLSCPSFKLHLSLGV